MSVSSRVSVLIAGVAISVAGSAYAQSSPSVSPPADTGTGAVSAEKTSPIKGVIPGAYSNVELRQDTLRDMNPDGTQHADQAGIYVLPKIGMTFFDDKIDSAFTWEFRQLNSTNHVEKYDAWNETIWSMFSGKFGGDDNSPWQLGPYAFIDTNTQGDEGFTYADIGLYGEVNYQFNIPTGALAWQVFEQPLVETVSRKANEAQGNLQPINNQTNRGPTELGITETNAKGDPAVQQQDNLYLNYFGAGVKYKPNAIKDLSFGIGFMVTNVWLPAYSSEMVDGVAHQVKDHYNVEIYTMNRATIAYKINDRLSVYNQLRLYLTGYDQAGVYDNEPEPTGVVGNYRWENRLALTATIL